MSVANRKEINRYLKIINVELLKKNHKECIELYNTVGGIYSDICSYDQAIYYHEKALNLCETIGDQLKRAVTLRYIGEAKASLGEYEEGVKCIKGYLEIVTRLNNKVEVQRAATTLGRVYLMQAQDSRELANHVNEDTRKIAREADKRFQTALNLADAVRTEIEEKEYMQMKSGLLINIALIKDILGDHEESVMKFNRALDLCRQAKLKEELYRCLNILGGIYRSRGNINMAVKRSDEALVVAKQIGKKTLICESLIERGLVRIWQRDFKNAKRLFAQAYLEKSPNEEDHTKAIKLTKIAHLIAVNHEQIRDDTASAKKLKLCDKLGDLLVAVNAFKLAVEFYKKAYKESRICNKTPSEKAKILFSIAETYADDGQYEHAIVCYEKELEFRLDSENQEQCQSLIKIAHMHEYLEHDHKTIVAAYEKAYARTKEDPKLMYNVLKYYVPYMKKFNHNSKEFKKLESSLNNIKTFREVIEEINKEDEEEAVDVDDEIADVDDIITDDDDDDEVMMIGRRRSSSKKFKPNEVGEMPLHEACIKGDLKRVKSLINQGHELNPRDNAGWTPLHEAANHGFYEIAEYLLEQGADVSNRGLNGMSPLHDAATNGHFDMMRLLIRHKANVIALTDSGETALSCLRDYKRRFASEMSQSQLTDYKQMEIELVNLMDKCGYNVMEEKIRSLGSKSKGRASSSSAAFNSSSGDVELIKDPVREYREAIKVNRKRKQLDSPEQADLPATFEATRSTSLPTKQWLIDDDSRDDEEEEDEKLGDGDKVGLGNSVVGGDGDGDCIDTGNGNGTGSVYGFSDDESVKILSDNEDEVKVIDNNDNCSYKSSSDKPENYSYKSPSDEHESYSYKTPSQRVVVVEGMEILVPEPQDGTIRELRETVSEIYSTIVNCKPELILTIEHCSQLKLLDAYKVMDVLKEGQRLIANIESWQLRSATEIYMEECRRNLKIEPLLYIRAELGRAGAHLDMAKRRYPREHIKAIAAALMRRDFTTATFEGSAQLFGFATDSKLILNSMVSWRLLRELNLRCVALKRDHFETICKSMKLSALETLDMSYNLIIYKELEPFKKQIDSLASICPNLRRLNMKKNHLVFVDQATSSSGGDLTGILDLDKTTSVEGRSRRGSCCLKVVAPEQYYYSFF